MGHPGAARRASRCLQACHLRSFPPAQRSPAGTLSLDRHREDPCVPQTHGEQQVGQAGNGRRTGAGRHRLRQRRHRRFSCGRRGPRRIAGTSVGLNRSARAQHWDVRRRSPAACRPRYSPTREAMLGLHRCWGMPGGGGRQWPKHMRRSHGHIRRHHRSKHLWPMVLLTCD